jgi:hypothetical protein
MKSDFKFIPKDNIFGGLKPKLRMAELYLQHPIRLNDAVLN